MSLLTLSLCMIVKNEEKNLRRCLKSVQGLVDQIVIVDTGSTDQTIEIGNQINPDLHQIAWPGDFAAARNISLSYAGCEWILVLDADEELDSAAYSKIKGVLTKTQAAGLRLCQRNLLSPNELIRYNDLHIIRVFRNDPQIRYEGMIHESVLEPIIRMGGLIEDTDLAIYILTIRKILFWGTIHAENATWICF